MAQVVGCAYCKHHAGFHANDGCTATLREGPGDERYCGCRNYTPSLVEDGPIPIQVPNQHSEALVGTTEGRGDAVEELAAWWRAYSEREIQGVVPKAAEYGSGDLASIGRKLAVFKGIQETISEERAIELGIYFYIEGKLARWFDALLTDRQVSQDTLHDLGIYTKMAIRNRQVGGWPGTAKEL